LNIPAWRLKANEPEHFAIYRSSHEKGRLDNALLVDLQDAVAKGLAQSAMPPAFVVYRCFLALALRRILPEIVDRPVLHRARA
jgi:hypothetical protein